MTIHEHDRLSTGDGSGRGSERGDAPQSTTHALVDRLNAGEPYAVAFGGQGSAWLETLEELVTSAGIESELATLAGEAELLLEPVAKELVVVRPIGFEPLRWVRLLAAEEAVPSAKQLTSAAVSVPGVLLTQIAAIRALARQGMDLAATPPVAVAGHSQGVLAVEALRAGGAEDVRLLALAQLIGAAGTLVARRRGISVLGDRPPMVSVTTGSAADGPACNPTRANAPATATPRSLRPITCSSLHVIEHSTMINFRRQGVVGRGRTLRQLR